MPILGLLAFSRRARGLAAPAQPFRPFAPLADGCHPKLLLAPAGRTTTPMAPLRPFANLPGKRLVSRQSLYCADMGLLVGRCRPCDDGAYHRMERKMHRDSLPFALPPLRLAHPAPAPAPALRPPAASFSARPPPEAASRHPRPGRRSTMATLRQMGRWMRSSRTATAPFRRYSAAANGDTRSGASAPAGSQEDEAHNSTDYCYALGEFGKIRFDRQNFVPFLQFIKEAPPFVPVPQDRLIDVVCARQPWLTSETAKDWMRSGFLAAHFAQNLGLTVKGTFDDSNVGIIRGLNIIAFLDLDSTPPSSISEKFPITFAGFADFLYANIEKVLGANCSHALPGGLQELMKYAADPEVDPELIIYHPELMSHEGLVVLFLEAFRLLRRQMPAQGEFLKAYEMIEDLHDMLDSNYKKTCLTDTMVKCWLGVHRPKGHRLGGLVSISGAAGLSMNTKALTKAEWQKLKWLVRKLYTSGGMAKDHPGSATASTATYYTTSTGQKIPKDPQEAIVLDVHQHCMAHVVEESSIAYAAQLPQNHLQSFKAKPMEWRDGLFLMLHRFPRFAHCLVDVFKLCNMWDALGLRSRFPIPNVFYSPAFVQKQTEF